MNTPKLFKPILQTFIVSSLLILPVKPIFAANTIKPAIVATSSAIKVSNLDPKLETAVIHILKTQYGITVAPGSLTSENFSRLGTGTANGLLDLSDKNITRLDGLEFADNVTCLVLANNQINNLFPLLGMDNLKALNIDNNLLKNTAGTPQIVQVLKGSLVFVYEGTQQEKQTNNFLKTSEVLGQKLVTIHAPNGEIFSLEGLTNNNEWQTIFSKIVANGADQVYAVNNDYSKFRLLPLITPNLIAEHPESNQRYRHYLSYITAKPSKNNTAIAGSMIGVESLAAGTFVYNVMNSGANYGILSSSVIGGISAAGYAGYAGYDTFIGNWEGLWPNEVREWYHDRAQKYAYSMIPSAINKAQNLNDANFISKIVDDTTNTEFNKLEQSAKYAFNLRVAVRDQGRLLTANQLISENLPDRDRDFDTFFKTASLKLTFGELTDAQLKALNFGTLADCSDALKKTHIRDFDKVILQDLNETQLKTLGFPDKKINKKTTIKEYMKNVTNSSWFSYFNSTQINIKTFKTQLQTFAKFDPVATSTNNTDLTKEQTAKIYKMIIESSIKSNEGFDQIKALNWIHSPNNFEGRYVPLNIIEQEN